MESILEKAKKIAEEAEVFMVSSEETSVQFEANRLKHVQSKQSTSVALRIIKEGKIGYATTTGLDNGQNLVNMAVESAQFGMAAEFEFPPLTSFPRVNILDPATEAVSIETMTGLGEEMITAVRVNTPDLLCEAAVSRGTSTIRIINS
ncbi:MAG: DNA gyrase modulator, partial [Dehalococcoidales bacterium]